MAATFIDTQFVVALINERDQYHERALSFAVRYRGQPPITTAAVILEVGNAPARGYKEKAAEVINAFLSSSDVQVVHLTPELLNRALALYQSHRDKEWGLVDCLSFVVMADAGISDALTFDRHFAQAGFVALLREESKT